MDPSWIEFLAERETIGIVPNFTASTLYLLQGDVGPFKAGIPTEVPLWIGLNLRQRQKCRFLQPAWMQSDHLEEVKEAEKESAMFTQLPNPYMFVMAQLVLDVATGDLTKADEVRTIIKDIWDIRQSKLRKVVDTFVQSGALRATLNNVQAIELNTVRPLLPHTLDQIHRLEMAGADFRRSQSQASQNATDRSLLSNTLY